MPDAPLITPIFAAPLLIAARSDPPLPHLPHHWSILIRVDNLPSKFIPELANWRGKNSHTITYDAMLPANNCEPTNKSENYHHHHQYHHHHGRAPDWITASQVASTIILYPGQVAILSSVRGWAAEGLLPVSNDLRSKSEQETCRSIAPLKLRRNGAIRIYYYYYYYYYYYKFLERVSQPLAGNSL